MKGVVTLYYSGLCRVVIYTLQKFISSNAPFGHMTKHATVADTEVVAVWIARYAGGGENLANEELVVHIISSASMPRSSIRALAR